MTGHHSREAIPPLICDATRRFTPRVSSWKAYQITFYLKCYYYHKDSKGRHWWIIGFQIKTGNRYFTAICEPQHKYISSENCCMRHSTNNSNSVASNNDFKEFSSNKHIKDEFRLQLNTLPVRRSEFLQITGQRVPLDITLEILFNVKYDNVYFRYGQMNKNQAIQ